MPAGQVLYETGATQTYAYFPLSCMVSNVAVINGHGAVEVGLVGYEGMVGVGLVLGISQSPARSIVQGKGTAIRVPAGEFVRAMGRNAKLRAEVQRCAYSSLFMAMVIAACNRVHGLEARLARWLLMTRDCLSTNTFEITQEFLGQMLGVRRPSVNLVAAALQRRRLISYRRGVVRLLDMPGLRAASCTCYAQLRQVMSSTTETK